MMGAICLNLASVVLLVFYSDGTVQSMGQYEKSEHCQKVVERILENGVSGGAKFLCFDPTQRGR